MINARVIRDEYDHAKNNAEIHRVPKKHVTTFSTITLTIGVRLQ